jgi:hypothetical protein
MVVRHIRRHVYCYYAGVPQRLLLLQSALKVSSSHIIDLFRGVEQLVTEPKIVARTGHTHHSATCTDHHKCESPSRSKVASFRRASCSIV